MIAKIGKRLGTNWKLIFNIVFPLVLIPLLYVRTEPEFDQHGEKIRDVVSDLMKINLLQLKFIRRLILEN
jgi:hypothetical protein